MRADGTAVKPVVRLAIVNDYAVVSAGVAALLAGESIDVVETEASLPVLTDVDIVLYDTFGQVQGDGIDLEDFVRASGAKVVIYSWNLQPDLIQRAIDGGASGYLSKVLTLRSLPEIGRRFGGRDHTTVLHAVRKIEKALGEDHALSDEVELLKRMLQE